MYWKLVFCVSVVIRQPAAGWRHIFTALSKSKREPSIFLNYLSSYTKKNSAKYSGFCIYHA